jgi:hypothetical protein
MNQYTEPAQDKPVLRLKNPGVPASIPVDVPGNSGYA